MRTRTFSFSRSLFDGSRCVLPTHPILPTVAIRRSLRGCECYRLVSDSYSRIAPSLEPAALACSFHR